MSIPNILVIAPFAPPQNAAEAIQVQRMLAALDSRATGRVVTVAPDAHGWAKGDASLALTLTHFDTQHLTLPLHRFSKRVFMSHRLRRLHLPDAFVWITWLARRIVANLTTTPDIIYSRSYPISAALLAHTLKRMLNIPWVMHLSDPWADNPYAAPSARAHAQESACFHAADLITLTTASQAAHYQQKYPTLAHKIMVSPNVMADADETAPWLAHAKTHPSDDRLHLVFAGNLYGDRSPAPLVCAIDQLRATRPELLAHLHIDVYGHAQADALGWLARAADVMTYHGPVSFAAAYGAQAAADAVLSIEPELAHPLGNAFLPSKVVDCLALRKALLAITPSGSETEILCREGYGWAVAPSQPAILAARMAELIEGLAQLRATPRPAPPARYQAATVADVLIAHITPLRTRLG